MGPLSRESTNKALSGNCAKLVEIAIRRTTYLQASRHGMLTTGGAASHKEMSPVKASTPKAWPIPTRAAHHRAGECLDERSR